MASRKLALLPALICAAGSVLADPTPLIESFEFYGSLRGHIAGFEGELEVQDNSSRAGLRFSREFGSRVRVLAGTEFSINLFDSDTQFRLDANTTSGFITIEQEDRGNMFGTRLGYLGLDFGRSGSLVIGKQWSVYYDVAGLTDQFDVFGGEGGQTFVGGTDGGGSGTGRVEQAAIYRNKLGRLDLGLQLHMRAAGDDRPTDGFAFSLRYPLAPGLLLGAAFVRTRLDEERLPDIPGFDGSPRYAALGAQFERAGLRVALVASKQKNGDFATLEDPATGDDESVVFDATGFEVLVRWKVTERWVIKAGGGYVGPDDSLPPIDPDAALKYAIVGAEWFFDDRTYAYVEARADQSVTTNGGSRPDVILAGLRFDFSLKKPQ
ncbi:MAG: porin [Acidobacteria bacterium]|nr:porin [Acidobacteriota bacterium]